MIKALLIASLLLPVFVSGQQLRTIYPSLGEALDFSPKAQKSHARFFELLTQKAPLSQVEQLELDSLSQIYSETFESIWDVVGGGCSWYCGGGPDTVFASSTLKPSKSGITYEAKNAHDLSYETAWVEGASGYGIGEHIGYLFDSRSPRVTHICIANGYVKSESAYKNNGRPKTLKMSINATPFAYLALKDTLAVQVFHVDTIFHDPGSKYTNLSFEIMDVYPGAKWQDVAISEIFFDGVDVHCLIGETRIAMWNGTYKKLEDIQSGDSVKTLNTSSGVCEMAVVKQLHMAQHSDLVTHHFKDGSSLSCTMAHPWLNSQSQWVSYKPAMSIRHFGIQNCHLPQVGMSAKGSNKLWDSAVTTATGPNKVYALELFGSNTIILANGIWVCTE